MSQTLLQAFWAESSTTVTSIPTRYDPKIGQHIVCWKDIQRCFKDALCVMDGEASVLFLTDGNLEE